MSKEAERWYGQITGRSALLLSGSHLSLFVPRKDTMKQQLVELQREIDKDMERVWKRIMTLDPLLLNAQSDEEYEEVYKEYKPLDDKYELMRKQYRALSIVISIFDEDPMSSL